MGASFYHSMGFFDLIASSADEYVNIAVRLGTDHAYRRRCAYIIRRLSHVIWKRAEVSDVEDAFRGAIALAKDMPFRMPSGCSPTLMDNVLYNAL